MTYYPAPVVRWPYRKLRWALLRFLDIEDEAEPGRVYLRRFIIFKTPLCSLYVHQIFRPDGGRHPHNHPFNFWSWVVRGGYAEERAGHPVRQRRRWSLAATPMTAFHRIVKVEPSEFVTLTRLRVGTITVVATGRIAQSWGFLTEDGYVDNRTYLGVVDGNP